MELLSDGTRRALARWDGRPRQIAALICAALAAIVALAGGGDSRPAQAAPVKTIASGPASDLADGHVAAVLPIGSTSLIVSVGDRVDVYAASPGLDAASAELIAAAAQVLAVVPSPRNQGGSAEASGYVILELSDQEASALAGRADARLTVVVRPRDG